MQYNPKLGSFKNLNVYGFESEFTAVGHIPSFVSLPDAAEGERPTLLSTSTGRKHKSAGSSYATTSASIGEKNLAFIDEVLQNLKDKQDNFCIRKSSRNITEAVQKLKLLPVFQDQQNRPLCNCLAI